VVVTTSTLAQTDESQPLPRGRERTNIRRAHHEESLERIRRYLTTPAYKKAMCKRKVRTVPLLPKLSRWTTWSDSGSSGSRAMRLSPAAWRARGGGPLPHFGAEGRLRGPALQIPDRPTNSGPPYKFRTALRIKVLRLLRSYAWAPATLK
jgi:hypothetical protein